jgi:endosialidase-like protein
VYCVSSPFGCPSLAAKGRRNRLSAINKLPCHQGPISLAAFPSFPEGSCSNIFRFTSLALLCLAACSLTHAAVAQVNSLSSSAPNTVGLWANGTEYLHIGSTGNVGIDTTSPNTTLQVNGSIMMGTGTCGSSTAGSIQWNGSALQYCNGSSWTTLAAGIGGSGTTNYLARWTPNGTTLGIGATYDNGTDVGIGNTSPTNVLSVGPSGNVGQTSAYIQARNAGNSFEWGHGNAAGYASTLGAWAGSGQPFMCFDCEAGTTGNTFKTRGIKGALLESDLLGGFIFATVPTASADNQTATDTMVITTGGNVGIGTTSLLSGFGLEVTNGVLGYMSIANNAGVYLTSWASGTGTIQAINASEAATLLSINPGGGNVGIGTTAPTNLVEVAGGSLNGIGLMVDGTSNTVGIGINNFQTGGRNWSLVSKGGSSGTPDAFAIQDSTASGANRIVIDASGDVGIGGTVGASSSAITAGTLVAMASGNVGIGTTGPAAALEVVDTTQELFDRYDNSPNAAATKYRKARGTLASPSAVQNGDAIGAIVSNAWDGGAWDTNASIKSVVDGTVSSGIVPTDLQFLNMNASGSLNTNMVILANGNVGIGVTNPANKLDVAGGVMIGAGGSFAGNADGTANSLAVQGSIGIGTPQPQYNLDVYGGTIRFASLSNVSGVGTVCLDSAYPISWVSSNTCVPSDRRLKERIKPLGPALNDIMRLRPVTFYWNKKSGNPDKRQRMGLIAQEVEKVTPDLVNTDSQGMKSVSYDLLVSPLIKAVQELKADNDELKAANDSEAAQIKALTARLDAIEAARH